MQREILDRIGGSDLKVYALWLPILGGSQQAADVSQRVLPDPRVLHYWDGSASTSEWFARKVENRPPPVWDVYYLYEQGAEWTDVPAPLAGSGATIIGRGSELKDAITPILRGPSDKS